MTKNAVRCSASTTTHGSLASKRNIKTRISTMGGMMRAAAIRLNPSGRANASTNVNRYSARGKTHKSGIGARSVVMCAVTLSSRLLGTSASAIQRERTATLGADTAIGVVAARVSCVPRHSHTAATASSATSSAYPTSQATLCSRT